MGADQISHARRETGFSLVELLIVLAVVGVLTAMLVPVVGAVTRAMAISNGGSILYEELTQARVAAMSLNRPVEVRLYLTADAGGISRDAVQLFVPSEDGATMVAHTRRRLMPETVTILRNAPYSSLLGLADGPNTEPGGGSRYYSFRILPQGTLDLSSPTTPTLTVAARTDVNGTGTPNNFAVIQINPRTARVQMFRP